MHVLRLRRKPLSAAQALRERAQGGYGPDDDPVHGSGWNSASRWGGWGWLPPRYGDHFRTCSFCGSISPEDLAAEPAGSGCGYPGCPSPRDELANVHFPVAGQADEDGRHRFVNTGWRAGWADRKYGWPHKFYVEGLVPRDPSLLHVLSHITFDPRDASRSGHLMIGTAEQWVPVRKLTRAQRRIVAADGWGPRQGEKLEGWFLFDTRPSQHAKFYTIHLADPAVPDEAKEAIQRTSGLWFDFSGGRVRWAGMRSMLDAPHEEAADG